jgi:hypothetical protein
MRIQLTNKVEKMRRIRTAVKGAVCTIRSKTIRT